MKRLAATKQAYASNVDILANAYFSEKPERLGINELAPEIQARIMAARLDGLRPICIYWPDGKYALTMLEPHQNIPHPSIVIDAYRACQNTDSIFPEASVSWHI